MSKIVPQPVDQAQALNHNRRKESRNFVYTFDENLMRGVRNKTIGFEDVAIWGFLNNLSRGRSACASDEYIASWSGMSLRTVQRVLARLKDEGFILIETSVRRGPGGPGKSRQIRTVDYAVEVPESQRTTATRDECSERTTATRDANNRQIVQNTLYSQVQREVQSTPLPPKGGKPPKAARTPKPTKPKLVPEKLIPAAIKCELVVTAFADWVAYRKRKKNPFRDESEVRAFFESVELWTPVRFCAAVTHSMGQGYSGLVEARKEGGGEFIKKPKTIHERNKEFFKQREAQRAKEYTNGNCTDGKTFETTCEHISKHDRG